MCLCGWRCLLLSFDGHVWRQDRIVQHRPFTHEQSTHPFHRTTHTAWCVASSWSLPNAFSFSFMANLQVLNRCFDWRWSSYSYWWRMPLAAVYGTRELHKLWSRATKMLSDITATISHLTTGRRSVYTSLKPRASICYAPVVLAFFRRWNVKKKIVVVFMGYRF